MRFRLVEEVSPRWSGVDFSLLINELESNRNKRGIVKSITNKLVSKLLPNVVKSERVKKIIEDSIDSFGVDPKENEFLSYLLNLYDMRKGLDWSSDNLAKNLDYLSAKALSGDSLDKEWFYDEGVLLSPSREFLYTLNIADVLSDKNRLEDYFEHVDDKGVENIFDGEVISTSNKVKSFKDIYQMIANWTKSDSKKAEKKKTKSSDTKSVAYSIKDAMDSIDTIDTSKFNSDRDYLNSLIDLFKIKSDLSKTLKMLKVWTTRVDKSGDKQIRQFFNDKVLNDKTYNSLYDFLLELEETIP